jgi:hypothetical protein
MAKITLKNLSELKKYVDAKVKESLQKDEKIKDVVVDEMIQSIEENVYSQYTPRMYERQKDDGGLTDPSNFKVEPTEDGVAIYSTREGTDRLGNDVYVAEIIEGYAPYSIPDKWGYGYEEPRHFVEPAREKLRQNGKHVDALKESLKNKGLDVK